MNIEMFSQMYQSLFAYAKRILVVCAVMMSAITVRADFSWEGKAQLTVYGQVGKGKVYIAESSSNASVSTPADDVAWTYDSKNAGQDKNVNNQNPSAYFAIHAKADTGFYFEGWYSNSDRTTSRNITAKDYNVEVKASGSSGKHEHFYANFARIISDVKVEKIFVWTEGSSIQSSRAKVVVPVHAAQDGDVMTIDIIGSGDEYLPTSDIRLYNADNAIDITSTKQITRSADGTFVFYVGYQGSTITDISVLLQKKIGLKVVAKGNPDDRDSEVFDVTIAEAPILTFKGTNGKGTYSSNLFSTFDTNSNGAHEVAITNPSMLSGVTLNLLTDPTDGEIFFGWKVTKLDGRENLISYAESYTAPDFEGGETIEAVFIPNTCGYIIMNGTAGSMSASNNNMYVDLHLALVDAETLYNSTKKSQFVVLENLSTILKNKGVTRTKGEAPSSATSATLPNREGGYTIPAGVTLLIPADNVYNYCLGEMSKDYYGSHSLKLYRKLVVESGTQITVDGNICVFGLLNVNTAAVGSYGMIELQDGSHIDVNGGLYVYGYIANPQGTAVTDANMGAVGNITANTDAEVYEVLQMRDWRGGNATSGMISGNDKVFPINQYYVQNIEVPITLKEGCREILTTAIEVSYLGKMLAHPKFILPLDDREEGFFLLGKATSLTKYYDWKNDRLKCIAKGEPTSEVPNPIANISSMNIALSLYNVKSANFVLPITSNIDIRMTNITLNLPNSMCLLAGASLVVDDNAKVFLNGTSQKIATCYVYDKEWNTQNGEGTGSGYFGMYNGSIALLDKRPGVFNTPRRTIDTDATMIINGLAEIGQHGALYTTAEGSEGYTYGANIISTGSGRIKFVNIGTDSQTKQVTQSDNTTTPFSIPVSSARLKNSDGTFVQTNPSESTGKSYIYIDGSWQIPTWVLPTINITLPTQVFPGTVDYPITDFDKNDNWTATLLGDGFTFDGMNKTITLKHNAEMGNNITLPILYSAQNIQGNHDATLTLTNTTKGESYNTTITATEDYTPRFNVTPALPDAVVMPLTYLGSTSEVTTLSGAFQIAAVDGNVTSFMNHMESEYYKSLSWSSESNNSMFRLEFAEGREALSNAKIIFEPTVVGTQSATIKIVATYTDAASHACQNVDEIVLEVTAEAIPLAGNTIDLSEGCRNELADMCVNVPVTLEFEGLTANTKPLRLSIENNGSAESPIIQYTGTGTVQDPFVVTANTVPTTKPTIRVTQDPDYVSGYASGATEYQPTIENCYPDVEWNWNEMYFGRSYDNPITTNSTGAYTLTLKSVTKDGTSVTATDVIVYDSENNTATIMPNLTGEYVATFEFEQDAAGAHIAYTQTFEANIYSAPNILPLCVNSERVFTAATSVIAGDVKYNAIANEIAFQEKTSWTMTFIGVPDILSFTPTTNTQLTIEQSENGNSYGIVFYSEVATGENYQVELSPATKFVRFTVVGATTLTDLCLTELNRVRISPQILYIPISNDPINNPTKRTITVTYASEEDIDFRSSDVNITTDPQVLTQTADGEYRVMNVTVSSAATAEYNTSIYVQHPIGDVAEVDIETYQFPQKLPIQLESGKDEAKRFYFVTDVYKNSEWDAEHYAIKMQNKTSTEDNRPYVTFVFDGAPSFLRFAPIGATNVEDWLIEEGVDANSLRPTTGENLLENGVLKQNLEYTSRCVCVTYIGASTEVVQMTNVNILSDQSAIPNPEELTLTEENKYGDNLTVGKDLTLTVVNLTNLSISIDNPHFTLSYGTETPATTLVLGAEDIQGVFGEDMVSTIPFKVFWDASLATDFGSITFSTEIDGSTKTLATVPLVGTKTGLAADEIIYTGVKPGYTLNGSFGGIYQIADADEKSTLHRPVDLSSTYDKSGKPLFDYLIIYGETSTTDGSTTITTPTTTAGSNANTPVYVYENDGDKYKFAMIEENANSANKMLNVMPVASNDELRIYMTGFCPYATTGYTKEDEGVWYFQGENGAKLHIYLEDCYLYSRYKTVEGRAYNGRFDGQAFSESYVRGSGGVMVFENKSNDKLGAFDVTIHTKRYNMLKSHYGCFFELMQGMRAYQVSSPIQVHLASENHQANSVTTITFDDKWPIDATDYNKSERTNGFLSLQKQVNNAPSIDLGNANTIINFKGGQVELQNAAVVSPNYKTTLAISFRSGLMAGFPMALGIGTDDVGGQVHFYDGTTTVIPMYVDPKFKDYYLLDTDAEGQYITSGTGDNTKYLTSCLRCPTHTRIYGGSHCMMRACEDVTSKGGAPMDENGALLGIYKYPKIKQGSARGGFGDPNAVGLVIPTDISDIGYNAESVTPNADGTVSDTSDDFLNFWFTTDEESSVKPEVDKTINFWKACMTEISAEYMSYGGTIGGKTKILPTEDIKYLLYCQIDQNISNVITAGTVNGDDKVFTYEAPVKDPTGQLTSTYLKIKPDSVGDELQNYIESIEVTENGDIATGEDYTVTDKVYYVVPTTADTWMSFTAPFNVEKLWVVEAYDEAALAATPNKEIVAEDGAVTSLNHRESVLLEQARHNADFAAFFGVAMALGRDQTFEEIYNDYIGWAEYTDKAKDKRGKIQLQHYNGTNFSTANYYLYKNNGYWEKTVEGFKPAWEVVGKVGEGDVLMEQGETYSLLFPYCTGCDVEFDENGNLVMDENGLPMLSNTRDYWDYWSGKFLIFESTLASAEHPHTIKGSNHHDALFAPAFSEDGSYAVLTGNNTFALMQTTKEFDDKVYTYMPVMNYEGFMNQGLAGKQTIEPTVSFLIANIPAINNMPAKSISRDGKINYGKVPSGVENGKVPTIGGGNDIFVTSIADGINIAVAAPQLIKVMSASGSLLFNGWVDTSVDVAIPGNGIYVVAGENTSLKILH